MIVTLPAQLWEKGPPVIRAESGRELTATYALVRVVQATTAQADTRAQLLDHWLGAAPRFEARPIAADATRQTLQALFDDDWSAIALVEQPAKREGATLVVGSQRASVRWLQNESRTPRWPALHAQLMQQAGRHTDDAIVQHLVRNPAEHWRAWLLTGEIPALSPANTLENEIARAVAARGIARAATAMEALASVQPSVASQLHARLTRTLMLEGELTIPAWTASQSELEQLWDDASSTSATPLRRTELVQRWLKSQPAGVAWVEDDASVMREQPRLTDGELPRLCARIKLANLESEPLVSWVRVGDGSVKQVAMKQAVDTQTAEIGSVGAGTSPEMQTLAPGKTTAIVIPHADRNDTDTTATSVRAGLGTWVFESPLLLRNAFATPPQFVLGSLRSDHTLESWLAGSSTTSALGTLTDVATSASLMRITNAAGSKWVLMIECDSEASLTREVVRVEVGPTRTRIDISPTSASEPGRVIVEQRTSEPKGWRAWVWIPDEAIEDKTLMLGLSRETTGPNGTQRACWPRAIVPWQSELPRARIDLATWDPLAR
jgi:hypothetical protein